MPMLADDVMLLAEGEHISADSRLVHEAELRWALLLN